MHYNKAEHLFATFLSNFPKLKQTAKFIYQALNYVLYKRREKMWSNCKVLEVNFDHHETFFGYYDKSPINDDGSKLICHATKLDTKKLPDPSKPINIVLYDFNNKEVKHTYESNAYNWQQGARCQWLDNTRFIFNDYDNIRNIYVSKIVNAETGQIERIISAPIYDTCNSYALTLNFSRLMTYSADYAYRNNFNEHFSDAEDGIFYVDLKTNAVKLICSLEQISQVVKQKQRFAYDFHEVNHIMISSTGNSFIFLYRLYKKGVKTDKLIWSDILGKNIKVINKGHMVSHCFWLNDTNIVCYMKEPDLGNKYMLVNVNTSNTTVLGNDLINEFGDGHPNIHGNYMVFDTYPNKARLKELYVFNIKSNSLTKLGHFLEPLVFHGQTRCDLHPRWSKNGKYIFFDSVHTEKRKLNYIEFEGE